MSWPAVRDCARRFDGSESDPERTAMKAIAFYELSVLAPTVGKVAPGTEWLASNRDGTMRGFGASPLEAVAAAVKEKTR